MKEIQLRGKYAVGVHAVALVDDQDFERLNRHKWKAKPNGSKTRVYAVRTQHTVDGRTVDVRMHRVVLGYEGPLDVGHRNRNTLDNQRQNLRTMTRSENVKNTSKRMFYEGPYCVWPKPVPKPRRARPPITGTAHCKHCGVQFNKTANHQRFCSEVHKDAHRKSPLITTSCAVCTSPFETRYGAQKTCSNSCKGKLRRANAKALGSLYEKKTERVRNDPEFRLFRDLHKGVK